MEKLQADKIWSKAFRGQGVVVAHVGTGVSRTHEALANNFRSQYGWFDPYEGTNTPTDQHGSGTHATGIMLGQHNGIGVAPDAQWTACKACTADGCSTNAKLLCFQWTVCPTDANGQSPNCSLSPNIVSVGIELSPRSFEDDILAAYEALNTVVTSAIGDAGPSCGSANYFASRSTVIGVAATTRDDYVAAFSSTGPSPYDNMTVKPDVAAPGHQVWSASHESTNSYVNMSGTNTASAHVSGLVALLLSKDPSLTAREVRALIKCGTECTRPNGGNCGGINDTVCPNYHAGYGRVSAPLLFACLQKLDLN